MEHVKLTRPVGYSIAVYIDADEELRHSFDLFMPLAVKVQLQERHNHRLAKRFEASDGVKENLYSLFLVQNIKDGKDELTVTMRHPIWTAHTLDFKVPLIDGKLSWNHLHIETWRIAEKIDTLTSLAQSYERQAEFLGVIENTKNDYSIILNPNAVKKFDKG